MPRWVVIYVADPLERAGSTFLQQFIVLLIPFVSAMTGQGLGVATVPWGTVADASAFAAAVSLLTSVATFMVPKLPPLVDLLLRCVKTFVQSFVGVVSAAAATPSLVHGPWELALATAFPVAAMAFLKGLGSMALPWTDGASLLPVTAAAYVESVGSAVPQEDDPLVRKPGPLVTGTAAPQPDPDLDSLSASTPSESGTAGKHAE